MSKEILKLVINGTKIVVFDDDTITIDTPRNVDVTETITSKPVIRPVVQNKPGNARTEFIKYRAGPWEYTHEQVQQKLNRISGNGYRAFNREPVIDAGNDVWLVLSATDKDKYYVVYKEGMRPKCSCRSFHFHHKGNGQCKHIGQLMGCGVL